MEAKEEHEQSINEAVEVATGKRYEGPFQWVT